MNDAPLAAAGVAHTVVARLCRFQVNRLVGGAGGGTPLSDGDLSDGAGEAFALRMELGRLAGVLFGLALLAPTLKEK